MRILVTGFNAPQVGSKRIPLRYATGCHALVETLAAMGHEVDWRSVIPGEQLTHDRAIVYVAPPTALTAQHLYGALWAYHSRPDAVVALDDWQTREIKNGFATIARDFQRMWKSESSTGHRINKYGREEAQGHRAALEATVVEIDSNGFQREMWAPIFPGGDPTALGLRAKRWWSFDPSGWLWNRYNARTTETWIPPDDELRIRGWVCASLLDKAKWVKDQKLSWPILELGNKKQGQVRVPEAEVFKHYASNWGVLCPPHYHVKNGSRWWRARYVLAANAGAVLVGDLEETKFLGSSYYLTPKDVENLTNSAELRALASAQASALWERVWSPAELQARLESKLNEDWS